MSSHEQIESPLIGLGILLFGVVLESISFHACLKEIAVVNTEGSLWKWFHNTTSTELLVIFTEDAAALFGSHDCGGLRLSLMGYRQSYVGCARLDFGWINSRYRRGSSGR